MRPQKVSVDVWKMVFASCSYLGLAFMAWIFLKLVNACFWLPKHLQEQEKAELEAAKLAEQNEITENTPLLEETEEDEEEENEHPHQTDGLIEDKKTQ